MKKEVTSAHILVAEDDPQLRELVKQVLEGQGYQITLAKDGAGALKAARREKGSLDLLLTDVMMPAVDGFDLREKILQERTGLKVLVMSGALDPEVEGEDFAILRKPFTPDELVAKVRTVMDGK